MSNSLLNSAPQELDRGALLTKAVVKAAAKLDITARQLASVLGLSETTLSRMKKGKFVLQADTKAYELGVLFVRLFRSLDAILGGDETVARSWLRNPNLAIGDRPLDRIQTIAGLMDVITYLDARRALI